MGNKQNKKSINHVILVFTIGHSLMSDFFYTSFFYALYTFFSIKYDAKIDTFLITPKK